MNKIRWSLVMLMALALVTSRAAVYSDRYNTQHGSAIGAGAGALAGQVIAHNFEQKAISSQRLR